jgi:hypothetical protein
MPVTVARLNEHTWSTFVRPAVKFKAVPNTRKLIETIMPYYPKQCICIAGYLDDSDQYWKVNYHWELLVKMLNKALTLKLDPQHEGQTKIILQHMMENPPTPQTGYVISKVVGQPQDTSSREKITKRWEMMRICKQEFRLIVDAAKLTTKAPPAQPWDLAVAPVARPGTSKHGCGYALDIQGYGQNGKIKQISKALGATLAFDEKSHVHVEFKNGVKV